MLRLLFAIVGLGLASAPIQAGPAPLEEIDSAQLLAGEGATSPLLMPPQSMHERVFRVPVDNYGTRLIVTMLTPDGTGPFPLAVVNHGSSKDPPARQTRYRLTFSAYYFLSRGYAVLLPMMRGYAGSDGKLGNYHCELGLMAHDNARDINAVIDAMAGQPGIDTTRVVIAGQSFGGWNTLAFGTIYRPGVMGLINFNGGVDSSACPHGERALIDDAGQFAKDTTIPSIWVYGQTDHVFRPALWRAVYNNYVKHGGRGELVDIAEFFTDSHQMLSYPEALPKWVPRVDAFLAGIGMPHIAVFPGFMPSNWPAPSDFAPLDAIDHVPYLTESGRDAYRRFLAHGLPRAIAISPKGDFGAVFGGFDQGARALYSCGAVAGHACRLYAIDNDVVWQPFPAPPPPSHYAALTDASALPYLGSSKLTYYPRFISRPGPRALVLGSDGKGYGVYGEHAFEQAVANCEAHSPRCEPYVVNDDVVWSPARHP